MSRVTDACDDIVTLINAASFTSVTDTVAAVRKYMLPRVHHESRKLEVFVFPRNTSTESLTRNGTLQSHLIDVLIREPVERNEETSTTRVDSLMGLTDEISDLLLRADLSTQGQKIIGLEQEELFDFALLNSHHLFETTITLSIRDQF